MNTPRMMVALAWVLASFDLAVAQDTTRVSVDTSGAEANSYSDVPSTSADGQFVAFFSNATNLVAVDTNGVGDIFVRDRTTGTTERVSVDSSGAQADGQSFYPSISADGRFVSFESVATNLVAGDTNGSNDIFVHDRSTGITERVSVSSSGGEADLGSMAARISADGSAVAFQSDATNLVAGDTNNYTDIFVHDRASGVTERVSVTTAGVQANKWCLNSAISGDGRIVAFTSYANNLVPNDTNIQRDVFVHDRSTGITECVSVTPAGAVGDANSTSPWLSADGQLVAFDSSSDNLIAGDTNNRSDIFVRDRSTGTTQRVSVDSAGVEGNDNSEVPCMTSDGRFVAFTSYASNLAAGDTNGTWDVFVHDRSDGTTELASVDSSGAGGNDQSYAPSISDDGSFVAFASGASNLVSGDTNATYDVFVHSRCDASWTNYGTGFPGTNGVPSLTSQADPVLGTTVTLDLSNSAGTSTFGLLLIGYQRAQIHTSRGGDLLVDLSVAVLVTIPANGTTYSGAIPNDHSLCGFEVDLQAIESDLGAAKGISFTPGLELVLGH